MIQGQSGTYRREEDKTERNVYHGFLLYAGIKMATRYTVRCPEIKYSFFIFCLYVRQMSEIQFKCPPFSMLDVIFQRKYGLKTYIYLFKRLGAYL